LNGVIGSHKKNQRGGQIGFASVCIDNDFECLGVDPFGQQMVMKLIGMYEVNYFEEILFREHRQPRMDGLWLDRILSKSGYEYLCRVDDDFLRDKFNLASLEREIPDFKRTYESLLSSREPASDLVQSCLSLYGLVHARYIITPNGMTKMHSKIVGGQYGICPRILCRGTKLIPVGLSDQIGVSGVKLYCPLCEDLYNPKSDKHSSLDGAFFGSSFHLMFLMTYTNGFTSNSYTPFVQKVYGFNVASDGRK
jgi:casein kinase II subunit beta